MNRSCQVPLLILFSAFALGSAGCSGADEDLSSADVEQREALKSASSAFAALPDTALVEDEAALAIGSQLYDAYCMACHNQAGRGMPDLQQGDFNYGSSVAALRTTISDGRSSLMPAMGRLYGEVELGQIVAFVRSLPSNEPLTADEQRGQGFYAESCVACHGPLGRGNMQLGVPDITDDTWRHGDSSMNIRLVITRGVTAECPAHEDLLTDTEIELLTAFVLRQAGLSPAPN